MHLARGASRALSRPVFRRCRRRVRRGDGACRAALAEMGAQSHTLGRSGCHKVKWWRRGGGAAITGDVTVSGCCGVPTDLVALVDLRMAKFWPVGMHMAKLMCRLLLALYSVRIDQARSVHIETTHARTSFIIMNIQGRLLVSEMGAKSSINPDFLFPVHSQSTGPRH